MITDTSQNNRYERGSEGGGYFDLVSATPVAVRSPRLLSQVKGVNHTRNASQKYLERGAKKE